MMSKSINLPLYAKNGVADVVPITVQTLQAQGFNVQSTVMNAQAATLTVSKDNDGFQKIMGLGIECAVSLNLVGPNQLTVNVENKWTNKIIALAVGWILCFVPFITGIIGCINQDGFPDKIISAVQAGVASANANGGGMNRGFQQPQYGVQQNGYYAQQQQYGVPQQYPQQQNGYYNQQNYNNGNPPQGM